MHGIAHALGKTYLELGGGPTHRCEQLLARPHKRFLDRSDFGSERGAGQNRIGSGCGRLEYVHALNDALVRGAESLHRRRDALRDDFADGLALQHSEDAFHRYVGVLGDLQEGRHGDEA